MNSNLSRKVFIGWKRQQKLFHFLLWPSLMLTPISLHISSGSCNWRRPTRAKLTISWVTDRRVVVGVRGEILEGDLPVEGLPVLVDEGLGVREAEKKESERWETHGESDGRKAGRELFIWEDEKIRKHQSILCQASVDIKAQTPSSCVHIELKFRRGFWEFVEMLRIWRKRDILFVKLPA